MNSTRPALRAVRALRVARQVRPRQQLRFEGTTSSSSSSGSSSSGAALYGGLAGGAVAVGLGYAWYSFSGAKTAVNAAHQAKSYFENSKKSLQQAAPAPNEALDWLRKQTSFYASFVPGGKQYVDSAFHDLDTIREKHGDEVDKIVSDAYNELKGISNKDLSVSTATEAWQILQKHVKKITDLVGDSAHDILANHPQLQSAIGTNVEQLKSLGDKFGPDANKIVSDTWSQVRDIVAGGGISAATIAKLKQLINEKTEQVQKIADQAWSKGMDEVKPFLDKNPKVKELLDSNKKDLLTSGDLWSKVKEAAKSGKSDDLENFVKQSVDKVKSQSGNMQATVEKYIDSVLPGGASQIVSKLHEFGELAQKADTQSLKKLVEDTMNDIKQLLEKKVDEAKKILKDSKDSK